MALEISTVGATVKYAVETTAGTRPTTGYTEIPDVSEAPDFDMSVETLDASNITDTVTRYILGRQDPGGDKTFTLNHTENAITSWNTMVQAFQTAKAGGKQVWFEYVYPGATNSWYFSGEPAELGNGGIQQNAVDTIPGHVVTTGIGGWATAST